MLLTVDVGNTNTVLGLFDGDHLYESYRIKTDPRVTADELALMFRGLLSDHQLPDGIAVCSTVPAVLDQLTAMFDRYFARIPTIVVGPGVKTGVPILTDTWDGLDAFFRLGSEILVARSTDDAVRSLETSDAELTRTGKRARERVLDEHTAMPSGTWWSDSSPRNISASSSAVTRGSVLIR